MTDPTPVQPSPLMWLDGRDLIPTVAWHDPAIAAGFDPTGRYVETYWLPLLGPSSTWALRRIAGWLADAPDSGLWLPIEPLARSLGLAAPTSRNALARRALSRLVDFRLAYVDHDREVLAVRTAIPALTDRAVDRLPGHLIAQHRTDFPLDPHAAVENDDTGRGPSDQAVGGWQRDRGSPAVAPRPLRWSDPARQPGSDLAVRPISHQLDSEGASR